MGWNPFWARNIILNSYCPTFSKGYFFHFFKPLAWVVVSRCPLFEYRRTNKNADSKWISIPLFQPCCCPALSKWYQMMHSKPNSLVMYISNFFTGLKGLSASFLLMLMHYSNFWQKVSGVFFAKHIKSGVHLAFWEKKWLFIIKLIIRRGQNNNRIAGLLFWLFHVKNA